MKLYNIFLLGALGMMAVSCAEDIEPSKPQENPQEPIFSSQDGVTSSPALPSKTLTLESYVSSPNIPVVKLDGTKGLPESTEVGYKIELSKSQDFDKYEAVVLKDGGSGTFTASAYDLNSAQIDLCGKTLDPQTLYYRIPVYLNVDGSDYRYKSVDYYVEEGTLTMTKMDPEVFIKDSYSLVGTAQNPIKFDHSDANVYDDPVFEVIFNVTAAEAAEGYRWYVAPEGTENSDDAANWFGISTGADPSALEGNLLLGGDPAVLTIEGGFLLKVNMETFSYTLTPLTLYTPGQSNGWKQTESQRLFTSNSVDYKGFAHLNGDFKFTNAPDWDHTNYGDGGEGKLSTAGDAGNLTVPNDGLYFCEVNVEKLTYSLTEITRIGVIGDFNGWGSDVALQADASFLIWTGEVNLDAGGWKFRMNDAWTINLGGSKDNLELGGGNLSGQEAGTYVVTLDLSKHPYTCTLVKK